MKDHECISIFTANLLIGIAVVFGGTGILTKLKRNLSVNKRFPVAPCRSLARRQAQPVFITQLFFSYRFRLLFDMARQVSTLICTYKKDLE
jgi:hypothetical protein